jgi:hypothetical protein
VVVTASVLGVFVLFAFFLLEYATFFWFKRRYGTFVGVVAAHVVAVLFGGAIYLPLAAIGVLDLLAMAAP